MKNAVMWVKTAVLRYRLMHALFQLGDRAARLDWAVYESDLEADHVARSLRRARRRAAVFAAALQALNQPQGHQ